MKINHNLLNTGKQNHMICSKNPRLFSLIICISRTSLSLDPSNSCMKLI